MKTFKKFEDFTKVYPLSKTLRFELIPVGKTLNSIIKSGILEEDQHRANSYITVKKILDEYHKAFIEDVLTNFKLTCNSEGKKNSLEEFYNIYTCKSKDDIQKKIFDEVCKNLRKQIVDRFTTDERFKRIDKKELIRTDLISFAKDEEKKLIEEFKDFTTYFIGFHENRKNMYSSENKSTAIAYRLIHENLPRFVDNISVFEKLKESPIAEQFGTLYSEFKEYLNVTKICEIFKLDYYSTLLTQKQIDIYNAIIGGKTIEESNIKIKGLNEYINLYNQQQKNKTMRLPKLKPLYKQILSDRNAISWLPEQFESDEKVLEAIQKAYQELEEQVLNSQKEEEHSLKHLLQSLENYNLDKVYIRNNQQMTDISQKIFGDYGLISKALMDELKRTIPKKTKKETDENYKERLDKVFKSQGSISIAQINQSIQAYDNDNSNNIQDYFATMGAVNTETLHKENLFIQIQKAYDEAKDILNTPYPTDKKLVQDKESVDKIKNLLDTIKALQHFVKPLLGDGTEAEKDDKFYGEFTALWMELDKITPLYNKVRNYITQKPYSTEKIKLNFKNSSLMKGWDLNKEEDNTTIILRKDGLYYLAIMDKKHNKVFNVKNTPNTGECFEKLEYKYFKDLTTMVPKCTTQLNEVKTHFSTHTSPYIIKKDVFSSEFTITKDEYDLNNVLYNGNKKFQIGYLRQTRDEKGYKEALSNWIRFCLRFLLHYKSTLVYDISSFCSESKIKSYTSVDEFYKEINLYLYNISFRNVSVDYINDLVNEEKIYLFQIYNKDFSPYSKGTPNLHTLYWKMLFDERNISNVVYKLNGEAEVFFRKSSIDCVRPTHAANQSISNKNELNTKKESTFAYDLIKNKRYTVNKFQFHVPITMNFKSIGNNNINQLVNEYIKQAEDLHIIGIDRGERHLLYLSVIDIKGNIKEQYSLNEIINEYNGNRYVTNYHNILTKREDDRVKSRQSWQTIENIKELKEGYLSQVIHKISELMIKYNAIIVLEDLNQGFKRGRQKVESSVYQQFEKKLIDKLNYLADKKRQAEEPGGILNAYQLTNKFESFKRIGKQNGFIYYVPAWNTSKIDPVTGFVNLFDTRYETINKAKEFFNKFDVIQYNEEMDWFEFICDYSNFSPLKYEGSRTQWRICSVGNRIETTRDKTKNSNWSSREIVLNDEFKILFKNKGISISSNIKEEISKQNDAKFFKELLHLFKLTLQIRNSKIGSDIDYLQSPVADINGTFYNSEICDNSLPQNADANGAYNIARKGLWIVRQIKTSDNLKDIKLAISNKEWLEFAQSKPYLNV
ncbi:MAG: type V CRISPR-associated protein Cas12a/Cpf1 [Bacteroidales bacterium]|nr:type V CRISPR-associated protein Cas12a/Cpf1 [Bacteroidales bacterium]